MCTASWLHQKSGYTLFFNRDELRTRQIARSPEIFEKNGVQFIAPIDSDAGGSWIGVNEFGLSLCLLNYYHSDFQPDPQKKYISRGLLLLSLLDSKNQEAILQRLQQVAFANYNSFILGIFAPEKPVIAAIWGGTGNVLKFKKNLPPPLSSSSFDSLAVIAGRKQLYRENISANGEPAPAMLASYHKSHLPNAGPYSVCMHREDAHTVSFSQITVDHQTIEFKYTPGSPCKTEFSDTKMIK